MFHEMRAACRALSYVKVKCCFLMVFCTAAIQALHLLAIGRLQWFEHANIARLKFMGGMARSSARNDVVVEAESQQFGRFMRAEAITNKQPGSTVRELSSVDKRRVVPSKG